MTFRSWVRATTLLISGGLLLIITGCVPQDHSVQSEPSPASPPQPAGSAPCLSEIRYPEVPVWELNAELPDIDATPEYTQVELAIDRGDGPCGKRADDEEPAAEPCAAVALPPEQVMGVMLWQRPDRLTERMFAHGADATITELVTGRTGAGESFQYRMSAWRFLSSPDAADAPVVALVEECDDSVREEEPGLVRTSLFEEDEPHTSVVVSGRYVYLYENMHVMPDEGARPLEATGSGLLPRTALDAISVWWQERAPSVLAEP